MKKAINITRSIIDKIFFTFGLFIGSQIPNFVEQYRQRLGGRLNQAIEDLQQFQTIADKFHNGNLNKLIEKHLSSADTTFYQEGFIIKNLVDKTNSLMESYNALNSNLLNQIKYLIFNLDKNAASETWKIYEPGLILTVESIICALALGFLFSIILYFFSLLFTKAFISSDRNKN
ncbi:MAG: DUF2937 family protein [Thermodesulfobacteriota bacterium]